LGIKGGTSSGAAKAPSDSPKKSALIGIGGGWSAECGYYIGASAGVVLRVQYTSDLSEVDILSAKGYASWNMGFGTLGVGIGPSVSVTPGTTKMSDFRGISGGGGGSFQVGPGSIGVDVSKAPGKDGARTYGLSYSFGPSLSEVKAPQFLKMGEGHGGGGNTAFWF
jgi:hypothetical protein